VIFGRLDLHDPWFYGYALGAVIQDSFGFFATNVTKVYEV
jgi:hypothetical protein